MKKDRIQRLIDSLPDEVDIDALIEGCTWRRLVIAELQIAEGKTIDHKVVEERFSKFLGS